MSVFKKLKDVLFDVEEEEIPVITKEEPKKERVQKEENPIKEIKIPKEDTFENIEPLPAKKESNFNFPIDFEEEMPVRTTKREYFGDDDDLDFNYNSRSSFRENKIESEPVKKKDNYDYARYNLKDTKKEETKPFKPSPVISPVYGILDQNYTKDDVIVKSDVNRKNPDLDEVRKKAYTPKKKEVVEEKDEFDEPLKTLDEILIDNEDEKKEEKPIKKFEDSLEDSILDEPVLNREDPISVYDDELPDEPYADEGTKKDVDKEDALESDLFNLIDSMYEERNEREEEND